MMVLKRRSQVGGASGSLGGKLGSKVLSKARSKVVGQGEEQRLRGGDSVAQKRVHEYMHTTTRTGQLSPTGN